MPTLNLGRVRFNWRGQYDPLIPYEEYDCVEDDGQSYVCIAPVTGTGPNDTGGATYWGSMLIRSADYNQARQEAIDAATAAQSSATTAGEKAVLSDNSATTAAAAEALAERWANEDEDVEVEPGKFSSMHWAQKAAAVGDPNQSEITADQTSDTRTTAEWAAQTLSNQQQHAAYDQAIGDNTTAIGGLAAVTAAAFHKAGDPQPAWTAPTSTTLETTSSIAMVVGSSVIEVAAGTAITLPALSSGTDYTIYALTNATLQAVDADSAAPANSRVVGGFHVFLTGEIAERSLWDLAWRPSAPNPRGKALWEGCGGWTDMYLVDVDYAIRGFSAANKTIADGSSPPKIPLSKGGDGSMTYSNLTWFVAAEVLAACGMRSSSYEQFADWAYGVVERQAVGTDPVTTQHQAGHRSAIGVEQATGVMWQWGADINGTSATGAASWLDIADGRGDVYTNSIRAVLLGADWNYASYAGSRASYWSRGPSNSHGYVGARGVCDHLIL